MDVLQFLKPIESSFFTNFRDYSKPKKKKDFKKVFENPKKRRKSIFLKKLWRPY